MRLSCRLGNKPKRLWDSDYKVVEVSYRTPCSGGGSGVFPVPPFPSPLSSTMATALHIPVRIPQKTRAIGKGGRGRVRGGDEESEDGKFE